MNDKKKSKRFNKKLGGVLLIVVVCAICLNFLGMYVYKTATKDQDYLNYENGDISSNEYAVATKKLASKKTTTHKKPTTGRNSNGSTYVPGMPQEAVEHSKKKEKYQATKITTFKKKATTRGWGNKKTTAPSGGQVRVFNKYENDFKSVDFNTVAEENPFSDKGIFTVLPGKDTKVCSKINGRCSYTSHICKTDCKVRVSTDPMSPLTEDKDIVWVVNDKVTNITGREAEILTVGGGNNTNIYPCVRGKSCPTTTKATTTKKNSGDKNTTNKNTTKKNSGGNPATVKTTKTNGTKNNDNYPNKIDKEVWASGEESGGESIRCGDKLYVSACNNDADPICKVTKINGKSVSNTFIKKSHYVENEADTGCYQNVTRYVQKDSYYYTDSDLSTGKKLFPCGGQVTLKKTMDVACNDKSCEVDYNGTTIYLPKDALITYKPTCSSDPDGTCNSSDKQTNVVGNITIKICNSEDNVENRDKFVTCAIDYRKTYKLVNDQCGDNPSASCYREYEYTCTFKKAPGVSASSGIMGADGLGIINITGYDYGNVGLRGYFISPGYIPSESSNWEKFDSNNKATTKQPAGTYFVWAMNNKNVMSNSVLVKVYDADLSTTMSSFGIVDDNTGELLQMKQMDNKVANADQIVDAKYALLSNKLLADADGSSFDSLTTSYEITTTSNKIALYATLTSNDAEYVEGYEPRTVYLDYGENAVNIIILNKEGRQRIYSFIVTRIDDRDNDNTLKDIKLSKGKIDFDPYVTNYDVEIGKNTKKVSINAELNSEYSYFVEGFEPRTIDITEDRQSAVLKVMSDAGSIRSYVITFTKKGYTEEKSESTYLSSLSVPGTQLAFDRETYDYTVTVPYDTDRIPVYAFAESEDAIVEISDSYDLDVGDNQVEIVVKNGKNTKVYNLNIIRKQEGLDVSNSTKLGMLSIKGYDINFDPNVLDYTVKIKREKTLMIAATPESNRADIYMYGNNDLTGFSTVRIKVIAENGSTEIYSIDIKKDAYNKKLEIIVASVGCLVIIISGIIIISKRKKNNKKEYMEG